MRMILLILGWHFLAAGLLALLLGWLGAPLGTCLVFAVPLLAPGFSLAFIFRKAGRAAAEDGRAGRKPRALDFY